MTRTDEAYWNGRTTLLGKLFVALLLTSIAGALSGCNTIAGAGKDIERGGEVIRDTAKDVQKKL